MLSNKERIYDLLKGIETGDPAAVAVVNEDRYVQHNPQTHEGSVGLAQLFKQLSKTSPRVNIVRIFEDGDFVFAHTEYDFSSANIGFEVFRFEDGRAVEHWDNIQPRLGPNPSGHSMVDGPVLTTDLEHTQANRATVGLFVEQVLIAGQLDQLEQFVSSDRFTQHNPYLTDGVTALHAALELGQAGGVAFKYLQNHRLLAEGSFVLSVCEGEWDNRRAALYDLFRLEGGRLVEHWDTIEAIPPRHEWKNDNGKF